MPTPSTRYAASLAAALFMLASPLVRSNAAHAEEARTLRPMLDAKGVEAVLGRQGFREIAPPRRRGAMWVTRASAPDGRRMLAAVDAGTGEIAGLTPVDGPPVPPVAANVRF